MHISVDTLSRYVDMTDISVDMLVERLTHAGIEVERVMPVPSFQGVVIGRVVSKQKHPQADKLSVCTVDVGGAQPLTIVCGAPNVDAGQFVPVALEGARLPGGIDIRRTTIRGVASEGMICSAAELGLNSLPLPKGATEGIYVLAHAPTLELIAGRDFGTVTGVNDVILELSVTPNRIDGMNWMGLAHECAALLGRPMRSAHIDQPSLLWQSPVADPVEVSYDAREYDDSWWLTSREKSTYDVDVASVVTDGCPYYCAVELNGVIVGPSPLWLQHRLMKSGLRPMNGVVDVLHYVMLEFGQPMHAYDADTLFVRGQTMCVRYAHEGEQMTTLDGQQRTLHANDLIVTDAAQPLALAGVMGGYSSRVTEQTTRIRIESAQFSPMVVREMARRHGLRTEASTRFERGVNPRHTMIALQRAVRLLLSLYPAGAVSDVVCAGQTVTVDEPIYLSLGDIQATLGTPLHVDRVCSSLRSLGFMVKQGYSDTLQCKAPPWRTDIHIPVDVIEEVARLHMDDIPETGGRGQQTAGQLSKVQRLKRTIRQWMTACGFDEAMTYSLTTHTRHLEMAPFATAVSPISVLMPMSVERTTLRTSILPQLLDIVASHASHHQRDVAFFEIASVYERSHVQTDDSTPSIHIHERPMVAAVMMGQRDEPHWSPHVAPVDFYDLKGVVLQLCRAVGIPHSTVEATTIQGYHPGRTAVIRAHCYTTQQSCVLGRMGQIHPQVQRTYEVDDVYALELDITAIERCMHPQATYEPLPKFPVSLRDVAIVVALETTADQLMQTIRQAGAPLLAQCSVFDVYSGEQFARNNERSIAFSLVFRHTERTLTDEEVQGAMENIINALYDVHQARIRQS